MRRGPVPIGDRWWSPSARGGGGSPPGQPGQSRCRTDDMHKHAGVHGAPLRGGVIGTGKMRMEGDRTPVRDRPAMQAPIAVLNADRSGCGREGRRGHPRRQDRSEEDRGGGATEPCDHRRSLHVRSVRRHAMDIDRGARDTTRHRSAKVGEPGPEVVRQRHRVDRDVRDRRRDRPVAGISIRSGHVDLAGCRTHRSAEDLR